MIKSFWNKGYCTQCTVNISPTQVRNNPFKYIFYAQCIMLISDEQNVHVNCRDRVLVNLTQHIAWNWTVKVIRLENPPKQVWFSYTQLLTQSDCFKSPNILILKSICFKTLAIFVKYNIKGKV